MEKRTMSIEGIKRTEEGVCISGLKLKNAQMEGSVMRLKIITRERKLDKAREFLEKIISKEDQIWINIDEIIRKMREREPITDEDEYEDE
jgi:hypothetical protein